MKVIIIEDEAPAAGRLKRMLQETSYDVEVLTVLDTLSASIAWLGANPTPDLIFLDIELSDGLSLDLIRYTRVNCPVIFITAYDEYWQEAFEYNSIDYLLKPLKKERLEAALHKYTGMKEYFRAQFRDLLDYQAGERKYKDRFLVKRGIEYVSVPTMDISFFYASHKLVCLVRKDGSKFILDHSLSDMEKQIDPELFFRINRKYLVNIRSIQRIHSLPKSKLSIEVAPPSGEELIISAENSSGFKKWINR